MGIISDLDLVTSQNIPLEIFTDYTNQWLSLLGEGVDGITGKPLVHQEDVKPEVLAAKLRQYKDAECHPWAFENQEVLHQFSGLD